MLSPLPRDSDGDGYSDIPEEYILGSDPNDPDDSDPECAACLATTPAATPTPEEPGFEAVFANFFAPQKPLLKIQVPLINAFILF